MVLGAFVTGESVISVNRLLDERFNKFILEIRAGATLEACNYERYKTDACRNINRNISICPVARTRISTFAFLFPTGPWVTC